MLERSDLPLPVRRFLEAAYPEIRPGPKTIRLDARGTPRRRPLPALPFATRISVRPGRDRVMEISLGPVTLLRGLDAYLDGRGFTRVGRKLEAGPPFDQGAFHTLVLETLFVPSAWERLRLTWEAVDETVAHLLIPFRDGVERATVRFDPGAGLPTSYETRRHKGPGPGSTGGWRWAAGDASRTSGSPGRSPSAGSTSRVRGSGCSCAASCSTPTSATRWIGPAWPCATRTPPGSRKGDKNRSAGLTGSSPPRRVTVERPLELSGSGGFSHPDRPPGVALPGRMGAPGFARSPKLTHNRRLAPRPRRGGLRGGGTPNRPARGWLGTACAELARYVSASTP